ncbi:hypothetical protein G7Y89_g9078 [Cudoniella acicularis]|uniref:Clr5 domain-containing protein n=1 Tax=Cudoniella acicularis TaxID=354080 RepID=A0A8H4RGB3_9HELO|nr:hypothetical protein G7Y89_g9078 [Cudoniella acicularis]
MENFQDYTAAQMEQATAQSQYQVSFQPHSINNTEAQSYRQFNQFQNFSMGGKSIEDSSNFMMTYPCACIPPQTSPKAPPNSSLNHNLAQSSNTTLGWSPHRHDSAISRNLIQQPAQMANLPLSQQYSSQSSIRKRAPKAPTMTAEIWKPCEPRIKQLYADEGRSYKELGEVINKEFGLTATQRQYKAKIQKMKLERNTKPAERNKVVRHLLHRVTMKKNNNQVRVRGHNISTEKLARWIKEAAITVPVNPPSPLSSCISIYTNSQYGSPKMTKSACSKDQPPNIKSDTAIQRILKYSAARTQILEPQEAGDVFNDLQIILDCEHIDHKTYPDIPDKNSWNPRVKEDITRVRNLMNLNQGLILDNNTSQLNPSPNTKSPNHNHRHAAWVTPFGRVGVSFWNVWDGSKTNITGKAPAMIMDNLENYFAARVAIVPSGTRTPLFRVIVDFSPHLDPAAKITYQAVISNDSEVFGIVARGDVERLVGALEKHTASLTDLDEQGRSLLNVYAVHSHRANMCKFLINRNADVNAIECSITSPEFVGPTYNLYEALDSDLNEEERFELAQCFKICFEAGADASLETYHGDGTWLTVLTETVASMSVENLKTILELGGVFLSSLVTYSECCFKEISLLMLLADHCGYFDGSDIHIVDKAILLMKWKADISSSYCNGDTVLHRVLKCPRHSDRLSKARCRENGSLWQWRLSFTAPKDLLITFIAAGADVYAENGAGETPSGSACDYNRVEEWNEALTACGYDSAKVLADSEPDTYGQFKYERQTSKLSFEEYCQIRQEECQIKEGNIYEEDDDIDVDEEDLGEEDLDEDERESNMALDHDRTEPGIWNMEHGDENTWSTFGGEYNNDGMQLDLSGEGYLPNTALRGIIEAEEGEPVEGDDIQHDGIDFELNNGNDSTLDITERFFSFEEYLDVSLSEES